MQKKLKCSATIDGKPYAFTLIKTLIKEFNSQDFFTYFPYLYFCPKNQNIEFFSSGSIYSSSTFIKIESETEIPCFFVGDHLTYPSWQDIQKAQHIIPQKWVIKKGQRMILYEWDITPTKYAPPMVNQLKKQTDELEAVKTIQTIKSHIQDNVFSKYVFAVMQKTKLSSNINIETFQKYPLKGTKFFFKLSNDVSFLGITPEWLYKRYKREILVDAVAGTATHENTHELNSEKIIDEFSYVKKDIRESIDPLILSGSFQNEDNIIFNGHLAHRYNFFMGRLKSDSTDDTLVKTLHPTAAISGYPKKIAREFFSQFENFERGYFAAPIGMYCTKKAYVAIAIRSMLINNTEAYFFAGAGITKDSNPEHEWHELNKKMDVMRHFLAFCD